MVLFFKYVLSALAIIGYSGNNIKIHLGMVQPTLVSLHLHKY